MSLRRTGSLLLVSISLLSLLSAARLSAQVTLNSTGVAYTQNFDTLATSGTTNPWADNSTVPGWYAQFTVTPANPTVYIASTGTSTTGAIYSFGVAGVNALSDRALGSVGSGTPGTIYYGVRLANNTGGAVGSLDISLTGEQWRVANATAQKLDFQYQVVNAGVITDANTPATGWVDYDALDFTGPKTNTTASALDGNSAANRINLSSTLTVTVNAGQEIWFRWKDVDDSGSDDGLAIDDFSVTPQLPDTTPPTVTSVSVPANGTYTSGQNLDFTVSFGEAVIVDTTSGVPRVAVALNTGGTVYASFVSGTGTSALTFRYTIASGVADADGIGFAGSIDLNGGTIKDLAGNSADLSLNSVAPTGGILVDAVAPIVSTTSLPANATYRVGQSLDFTANFDENVTVTGTPRLAITLDTGGTVYANYFSGSGTSAITFRYTVAAGEADSNGIGLTSPIDANGGTLRDAAGNNAVLTLSGVGSTLAILVDGIAPTATSINRAASTPTTPTNAASVDFTVTFSENVTGVDVSDFTLTATGTAGTIASISGSGSTYSVTVNAISGDGTLRLDLKSSGTGIADIAGNAIGGGFATGQTYTIDQTAPAVTTVAVPASSTYAAGQNLDFTVTFGEAVTVDTTLGTPRIAITLNTGGTVYASYVSGSPGTALLFRYIVAVGNADPDGITLAGTIDANGGTLRDAAGNNAVLTLSGVGSTTGVLVDASAPTVVSVARAGSNPSAAGSVTFTVIFSASVTGVDTADFTLTTTGVLGASVSNATGSGTTWTVTVGTGSGDGTIRLDVLNDGTIKNALNTPLGGAFTSGESYTIDKTAPTVSSVTRLGGTPTNASAVGFAVTFSESVTGVDAADFALTTSGVTGASITNVTGSGTAYTVTVNSGSGDGTLRLDVANTATISDAAGNAFAGGFTGGQSYTIDKTAPTVSSVTRVDTTPTNVASVHFAVTFSESVTGVDAADFALTTSGVTGASITNVTGSGTVYTVTVNSGTGDGTIRLDVAANGTILDAAGNALVGGFTGGQSYTIVKTAPTVSSVTRVDSSPTNAAVVHFTVTFGETVTGVDAADFALTNSGITGASITNVTGSGAAYTVTVNTGTGDGTIRLDVAANGTIVNVGGNALASAFTTGAVYTIDKTVPTVTIAPAGTTPSSAATVDFTVTFSETISGVSASVFGISAPALTGTSITNVTGSGTTWTVTVNTGSGTGTLELDLTNGAAVTDAAGNAAANTAGQSYTMQPPAAPTGFAATAGNAHVALSWIAVTDATSYAVKRATVNGGPYTTLAPSVAGTTYDDTTAANGTTYYYVVSATGAHGASADSSQVTGTPTAAATAGGVVISQVYGGGGNTGSVYKNDFVELFNAGSSTVSVTGWSVQYASATGTSWQVTTLSGSIAPGHYYLVQESAGTGGTTALPTPEATGAIAMSGTAGKIALANSTTALTGGCPTGGAIVDFVGYGTTASCYEGSGPTTAPSNTNAVFRAANGCTDTNSNAADFSAAAAAPRNGASPANPCGGATNNPPAITAPANPIASVLQDAAPFAVSLTGTDDGSVYSWSATPGTGISSVSVTGGQGTTTATFTVTLAAGFTGTATFNASLSDTVNTPVTQAVNIAVSSGTIPPAIPTGLAATAGNAHVALTWSAVTGATGYKVKRSTVSGSGYSTITTPSTTTYDDTAVANGTTYYYVVSATNLAGESANSGEVAATPNYVDVVISQLYGGGGSGVPPYANDFVELFNRGASTADISGYSIQYGSATGVFGNSGVGFSGVYVFPAATTIPAGKYLTVKTGPAATSGVTFTFDLQTPTTDLNMSGTAGKVALASIGISLGCGATATPCTLPDARILDVVAYGSANNGEGGTAVNAGANLDATMGALRNGSGCTDTNNNNADFTTATIATGLVPRTLSSPANLCGPINHSPSINALADPITTITQPVGTFPVTVGGFDDGGIYSWSATAGNGISSVSVSAGQATANATFSVTLQPGFYGTATFTALLTDGVNPPVTRQVNIRVNPDLSVDNPPLITTPANPIATVSQDSTPFTVSLSGNDDRNIYNWSATAGSGIASVIVTAGSGTANVTFTVTLVAGFNGAASFTASLSDGVNAPATQAVNITVRSSNHLVISQLYGGGGNSGATYRNDYVELYNPTTTTFDLSGWTLQYASATATSFTNIQPLGAAIGPGQYFLIALASGGAEGADLPAANIYGDLNMSATNGKVALVSNGDGATSCTDPDVVDLVGYGTASCSEGANAPAMSNTTALFRKNGGRTDTDNNLNDFTIGAPTAPAPTAPIVEIGPSIVSSDPTIGGTNAPRDANITINFSEPVDVTTGWFNISCATSGVHNDATVARALSRSWVIIPNTNFLAAESCTVTVFKDFVHDSDLNDSAPGTDTLPADKSWSFTVATGTAPPYPANVHLTMGNPSGAIADVTVPNNYLMQKAEYAESYNRDRGTPNWVSWHLSDEWIGSLARNDTFRADPAVPSVWYRVLATDFSGSGFDRGHMTPNADRDNQTSIPINQATFLMSNMVAQSPDNNQGPWADFENYLRSLLPANELYIVSGPAGTGGTGSNGFATTIDNGHVTVPASTWKVVLVLSKASGDDVARVTASTRTIAINIPNVQGILSNPWQNYLTTVDAVETMTGYDFFSNVPSAIQNAIEAGGNGVNPPGVADESLNTREDTAGNITLNAVSANSSATFSYTIDVGPSHGTLSGAGANLTYTPLTDFNGADTFTFHVNDGSANSNTSTVTIAVLEVNDAPNASNDAKSTNQVTALTFAASDLTANDNAGPANESSQTLTVSAVNATASTHGTVVLGAGQVTYTPEPNFNGPASFTYTVCDNGITAGLSDPKCSTATVNVTVNPVPAIPAFSLLGLLALCLATMAVGITRLR